jgi:hypothetical protein
MKSVNDLTWMVEEEDGLDRVVINIDDICGSCCCCTPGGLR